MRKVLNFRYMENVENVVILGSGCAGCTAAIYAARAQLNPLILSGEMPGGLLTQTTEVENFPGFPDGIQGAELVARMRRQAERFGARFLMAQVQAFELRWEQKILSLSDGNKIAAKTVVITTGSRPNTLGLPNESVLLGGKGLSVCATCDGFFYRDEVVCVIGGGDSACEEALYLSKICKKVFLVHRRDILRASKIMAERVCNNEKIDVVWNSVPIDFRLDKEGFIDGLQIQNTQDHVSRIIDCKGVFSAIGWKPNTQVFKDVLTLDDKGYIKIFDKSVCTQIPGVFAAGDCVDAFYRQACVAAGMGAQAALEAEAWLLSHG